MRDALIPNIVIPAKAGIHWLLDGRKMVPSVSGDDVGSFGIILRK